MPTILIAADDELLQRAVGAEVTKGGYVVLDRAPSLRALQSCEAAWPDIVVLQVSKDPFDLVHRIRQWNRAIRIILLVEESSEESVIAALRAGANDYLKLPVRAGSVLSAVCRCMADSSLTGRNVVSRSTLVDGDRLVGETAFTVQLKSYIANVAATDTNVLITGETGTGKELVAALIHNNSPRRNGPYECINCAAIPEDLLESELFGHERGAFTGAHISKEGKLKLAHQGTIFLDEIGDMSLRGQAKILRAIESKEVHRVGGARSIPVDVRIVCATNQDLERLVTLDRFRNDLYFRLNVARIDLIPLRERKADIALLVSRFICDFNRRFKRDVEGLEPEVLQCLLRYHWPGNIRELRNLLEAVYTNCSPKRISLNDLPKRFRAHIAALGGAVPDERSALMSALSAAQWNISETAKRLNCSRMTLYRKMAKYQLITARPLHRDGGLTAAQKRFQSPTHPHSVP